MSLNAIATMAAAAGLISAIGCGSKAGPAPLDAADGAVDQSGAGDGADVATEVAPSADGMACVSRPAGGCDTLRTTYTSNDGAALSMSPELASCARFISFDGCGHLVFSFDQDGCLESDTSSPDGDDHLGSLRACFAAALGAKRWPCVAAGTVAFNESCFVP